MSGTEPEEVRAVVRDENRHLEQAITRLTESVDRVVHTVAELAAQSKANDEKFVRVHERIDEVHHMFEDTNRAMLTITTDTLPELETSVAVNSFSAEKMWKIAFVVAVPLVSGMWAVLDSFSASQKEQTAIIAEAVRLLATAVGG